MTTPLTVTAIGITPSAGVPATDRPDMCGLLAAWADAAGIVNADGSKGKLAVVKSDLLNRLVYGGEKGPSQTPCPVHKGHWSGCHFGWPDSVWRSAEGETPMDVQPMLQEWYDAGCRCYQHAGSGCTTGWNPDEHCCLSSTPEPDPTGHYEENNA